MQLSLSPPPQPQTQSDGNNSSVRKTLIDRSPSGERSRRPCKDYISGKSTNPLCDCWLLPYANLQNRFGMQIRLKCAFLHRKVDSQPNKKAEEILGERICSLIDEFQAIGLCIPGCRAAEIQFDFTEWHNILVTEAQRAMLRRNITPHENTGKKGSIARCDSAN